MKVKSLKKNTLIIPRKKKDHFLCTHKVFKEYIYEYHDTIKMVSNQQILNEVSLVLLECS